MTVSELGAYLQRHREERGWSLEDVEALTRIRKRYLVAMEAGDWDNLPPGVYTRGLLRNYARALGVSVNSVLRMYVKERPSEARPTEPQLISQPLTNEPRVSGELLLAGVLLVVAVGLIAWVLGTQLPAYLGTTAADAGAGDVVLAEDPPGPTATATATSRLPGRRMTAVPARAGGTPGETGDAASDPTDGGEAADGRGPAEATGSPSGTDVADAGRAAAGTDSPDAAPNTGASSSGTPGATATDTRPPSPPSGGLVLEVTAKGDAWILVRADGEEVYAGFVREGESRIWRARERVGLRTGNAGGTEIVLNGQRLDALGSPGDVEEREWRLLPNGDIEQRTL